MLGYKERTSSKTVFGNPTGRIGTSIFSFAMGLCQVFTQLTGLDMKSTPLVLSNTSKLVEVKTCCAQGKALWIWVLGSMRVVHPDHHSATGNGEAFGVWPIYSNEVVPQISDGPVIIHSDMGVSINAFPPNGWFIMENP